MSGAASRRSSRRGFPLDEKSTTPPDRDTTQIEPSGFATMGPSSNGSALATSCAS
jgi:hypothetical protein